MNLAKNGKEAVEFFLQIRQDFLEECYEAVEAIDADSVPMMREELGDVLLQVVFHRQIEAEQNHFTFDDICYHIFFVKFLIIFFNFRQINFIPCD